VGALLNVDSTPFKSKRFMPVFNDLRYLCHTAPVQRLVAADASYITQFAGACALFMCVNANRRAATDHVEYETDAWISVFNVTLSLSRVIKVYGEAFALASPAQLVRAITAVVHETLQTITLGNDCLDKTKFGPIEMHTVRFSDIDYEVVKFDVLQGWVSFHHSLHWLLAELIKHVNLLTEDALKPTGLTSLRDIFMRNGGDRAMLSIFDFPFRGSCYHACVAGHTLTRVQCWR
jgi:E3 ubiquitin-protein ligase UBR1